MEGEHGRRVGREVYEGMTTTWTSLEDVPVSFPSVGPNTSSPTTSRRRLVS